MHTDFQRIFHGSKRWRMSTKFLGVLSPTACAVVRGSKQQKKGIFDDQATMTHSNTIKNASISSFKAHRSNAKRKQCTNIVKTFKNGLKRLKNVFFKIGSFDQKLGYPQKLCVTDRVTTLQALFYKGLVVMPKNKSPSFDLQKILLLPTIVDHHPLLNTVFGGCC